VNKSISDGRRVKREDDSTLGEKDVTLRKKPISYGEWSGTWLEDGACNAFSSDEVVLFWNQFKFHYELFGRPVGNLWGNPRGPWGLAVRSRPEVQFQ
jgi:hypothetical protein